jgi:predicted NUDIX family NTP pyrophosphohydrolase
MEHNGCPVYRKVRECLWILPKGNKDGRESEEGAFHEWEFSDIM